MDSTCTHEHGHHHPAMERANGRSRRFGLSQRKEEEEEREREEHVETALHQNCPSSLEREGKQRSARPHVLWPWRTGANESTTTSPLPLTRTLRSLSPPRHHLASSSPLPTLHPPRQVLLYAHAHIKQHRPG